MNIRTTFFTLKLLLFSFSSCLTIERSIVFKTMDRQCESFSRIFSSATRLDNSFIFIRNTRTSSSINIKKNSKFQKFHKTCSQHVNLCWSLLSQKIQTLMNDWGNSIKCVILLVFIILRWSFNYESNVFRHNKILIDCVFGNNKLCCPLEPDYWPRLRLGQLSGSRGQQTCYSLIPSQ